MALKQGGVSTFLDQTMVRTVVRREDGSMGIKLRARPERNSAQTTVHGVEPKGPAELAGIRKGHVIVEVNGKCVVGWDHDQIVEAMRTGSLEGIHGPSATGPNPWLFCKPQQRQGIRPCLIGTCSAQDAIGPE